MHRGAFGEAADELVEELLGADLEVERVSAVLDADVEELSHVSHVISRGPRRHTLSASSATFWLRWFTYWTVATAASRGLQTREPLVARLPWDLLRRALLAVDQVRDFEVQREIRFKVLGVACLYCSTQLETWRPPVV
jgi:hypothetical protein